MFIEGEVVGSRDVTFEELRQQFYQKVMLWFAAAFLAAGVSAMTLGPMVKQGQYQWLGLGILLLALMSGLAAHNPVLSGALTIIIPAGIGALTYPLVNCSSILTQTCSRKPDDRFLLRPGCLVTSMVS